jgi:spore coat protein U-like protein
MKWGSIMNRFLLPAAALIGIVATQSAWATSTTATIALGAQVTTICSLSASAMEFGEVNLSGVTNGLGSITVHCTGGGTQRSLRSGTNTLAYGLFQDIGFATARAGRPATDLPMGHTRSGTSSIKIRQEPRYGGMAVAAVAQPPFPAWQPASPARSDKCLPCMDASWRGKPAPRWATTPTRLPSF